jgi:UDP-N-acetylmuramate: L-alanyl-gamma-D-glutamyl-meso-diaminopimelate ligase
MELRGEVRNIRVYDDFAHHPTAITTTVNGLRANIGKNRLFAVLEPRSNTMKLGVHKNMIADSLVEADQVLMYQDNGLQWSLESVQQQLGAKAAVFDSIDSIVQSLCEQAQAGDHILIMSNGGFGGIHQKLLAALENG